MQIHASHLCARFYVADGWTKKLVEGLIKDHLENDVELRMSTYKGKDYEDYYAVYRTNVVFDKQKVADHEFTPGPLMPNGAFPHDLG